jgi:peptidoglycan/LPS O-acetylase OafA/YrhL
MVTKVELSPEGPGRTFLPSVHGLRGISALLVYFFHIYDMSQKQGFFPSSAAWSIPIFKSGAHGVQIFFIISGFLIAGSIINHANAKRFLIDRCVRIYPVFLTIHLILFAVGPFIGYKVFSGISVVGWLKLFVENVLFLPGIFNLPLVQLNAWSLSYEALFYIIAVVTYVLASRAGRPYAWAFVCVVSAPLVWHYQGCIFFIMGVIVYFCRPIVALKIPRFASVPMLVLMLSILVLAAENPFLMYVAAIPGVVVFWCVMDGSCLLSQIAKTPVMVYFGTISYSFYLWHQVVMFPLKFFFAREAGRLGHGVAVLCFALCGFMGSVAVAHLSYKLLEVRVARVLKGALNSGKKSAEWPTLLSGKESNRIPEMDGGPQQEIVA